MLIWRFLSGKDTNTKSFYLFEIDNLEGYGLLSCWALYLVMYLTHQSFPNIKLPINTQPLKSFLNGSKYLIDYFIN